MRGREAVPAALGQRVGPAGGEAPYGAGAGGGRCGRGRRRVVQFGDQGPAALQDVLGQHDFAGGQRDDVDGGAEGGGELLQRRAVLLGAQIGERGDDIPLTGPQLVQGGDGVAHRAAGGQFVVDQDQRAVGGHQRRVGGQHQMAGVVAVFLLEPRLGHPGDVTAGGVQIRDAALRAVARTAADAVRDAVPQPGGGLRVPEHHGHRLVRAQQLPHPAAEFEPGAVHHARPLRHVLAQDPRHQQVRPLGVAPHGQAQVLARRPAPQLHAEPARHPLAVPGGSGHSPSPSMPVASRSTKSTPSLATPNTSARRIVRSAQARCGFTSFILLV
ncbi:hypothetical protein SUDANB171_04243 [Streptomyces sp. enrichment culture]